MNANNKLEKNIVMLELSPAGTVQYADTSFSASITH